MAESSPAASPTVPGTTPRVERRATIRFPVHIEGRCGEFTRGRTGGWPATVRDLSQGGIALAVCRRFEPGTIVLVELPPAHRSPAYSLLARVVRVQDDGHGLWFLGCAFLRELSKDEFQALL
jgi:hypothetical protein